MRELLLVFYVLSVAFPYFFPFFRINQVTCFYFIFFYWFVSNTSILDLLNQSEMIPSQSMQGPYDSSTQFTHFELSYYHSSEL